MLEALVVAWADSPLHQGMPTYGSYAISLIRKVVY